MMTETRYSQVSDTSHGCNHEELATIVDDGWHMIECARCRKRWDAGKRKISTRVQELESALREACDIGLRAHHSGGAGWRLALADLRKLANNSIDQLPSASTRSRKSEDARRDFDGFDVDEELRRLRHAMRDAQWRSVAELASNVDEHLCRGGSLPVAWLGPSCMQDPDDRTSSSVSRWEKMTQEERQEAAGGYVAVRPLSAMFHSSARGVSCCDDSCVEALTLRRTTWEATTDVEDRESLEPAHAEAAVLLGWRTYEGVWHCPTHVVALKLTCARCRCACPACSCMGGPRPEAVKP